MEPTTITKEGVTVPSHFARQLVTEKQERDPDGRVASIHDFIKAHDGENMPLDDFGVEVFGRRGAGAQVGPYLRRLRRSGRVTRIRMPADGTRGHRYTYKWHQERIKVPEMSNGVVRTLQTSQNDEPEALSGTPGAPKDRAWVITQAKEWAWSSDSDSLRDFVKFLSTITPEEEK